MKYLLVVCVVGLAAFGAHELWHDHSVEVAEAKDTAAQVGQVAEDVTRKVIKTSERIADSAKAAEKEFNKK